MTSVLTRLNSARFLFLFHGWAAVFWLCMLIPGWFLFRSSLFFVQALSIWALVATHWGAWQAVRSEIHATGAETAIGAVGSDVEDIGQDVEDINEDIQEYEKDS
jgi:hypothetical protein